MAISHEDLSFFSRHQAAVRNYARVKERQRGRQTSFASVALYFYFLMEETLKSEVTAPSCVRVRRL